MTEWLLIGWNELKIFNVVFFTGDEMPFGPKTKSTAIAF